MHYPNVAPPYGYPAVGWAQPAAQTYERSLAPWQHWNTNIIGAGEEEKKAGAFDKFKTTLAEPNSLTGVKNGYLLGGAAALGLIWYGYSKHWYGKKR